MSLLSPFPLSQCTKPDMLLAAGALSFLPSGPASCQLAQMPPTFSARMAASLAVEVEAKSELVAPDVQAPVDTKMARLREEGAASIARREEAEAEMPAAIARLKAMSVSEEVASESTKVAVLHEEGLAAIEAREAIAAQASAAMVRLKAMGLKEEGAAAVAAREAIAAQASAAMVRLKAMGLKEEGAAAVAAREQIAATCALKIKVICLKREGLRRVTERATMRAALDAAIQAKKAAMGEPPSGFEWGGTF